MQPLYPPVADLAVMPKPAPPDAIVTSERAAAEYSATLEGWGERGWAQVARLCRWAAASGMTVTCPAPR